MVTRLSSEEQRCDRERVMLAKSSFSVSATRENTYRHFRRSSWKRAKTWHGRTTLVILVAQNQKESQKEMSDESIKEQLERRLNVVYQKNGEIV